MSEAPIRASVPPMGWNSFDCFGSSVTEAEVIANAEAMAPLRPHGWSYVVVDYQWFDPHPDPLGRNRAPRFCMDDHGRLVPSVERFPSAAGSAGFAPLAARIHALGLRFGFHVLRGIPRLAVERRSQIHGSRWTAADIADRDNTCTWNDDMYGVVPDHPGAQDWYDSLARLYSSWGADYLKVDDISYPYHAAELGLLRRALDVHAPSVVLSLSPGPAPLEQAGHLVDHADLWRISGDFWDLWPQLVNMFELCHRWSAHCGNGRWPDADMIPFGRLAIRNPEHGLGERTTMFTPDEQVTLMTLWCMARSPLMFGGHLPDLDAWTRSLLTNDEVLAIGRDGEGNRQILREGGRIVWTARVEGADHFALFNLDDTPVLIPLPMCAIGIAQDAPLRDCWARTDLGVVQEITVAAHGARLFKVLR